MTKKFWITAVMFGFPWTIIMIVYDSVMKDGPTLRVIISAGIGGLVAGVLFAWSMKSASKRLFKKIIVDTGENENIIKEGGANHFKGLEAVGGKLVLTDKRLIFKSHGFNIQEHQESFDLQQLEKLYVTKTVKFLESGLTLELKNNDRHRFIVEDPKQWVEEIMNQRRAQYGH
jgi:hypothetical protein